MNENELLEKAREIVNIEMLATGPIQRRLGVSYSTAEHLRDTVIDELLEEALFLRRYQDWRKGDDVRNIYDAEISRQELTKALDKILAFFGYPTPLMKCRDCKHNSDSLDYIGCMKYKNPKDRECKFEVSEEE